MSRNSPAVSLYIDHQQPLLRNPKSSEQIFIYNCRSKASHHSGLQSPSNPPWCSSKSNPHSGQFLLTPQHPHFQPQRCHTNLASPSGTFHPLYAPSWFTLKSWHCSSSCKKSPSSTCKPHVTPLHPIIYPHTCSQGGAADAAFKGSGLDADPDIPNASH